MGYKVTNPLLGARPPGAQHLNRPMPQTEAEIGINRAADIWSGRPDIYPIWRGQTPPVTFDKVSSDPDVIIGGYWNPWTKSDPTIVDQCGRSIACTYGSGAYPELSKGQQLWIEFPPKFPGDSVPKRWTNDIRELTNFFDEVYYLPVTMLHELGHTAGLGHAPDSSYSIMSSPHGWSVPRDYDLKALKAIYGDHTPH